MCVRAMMGVQAALLLLHCSLRAEPARADGSDDILFRGPEQWDAMERIHRTSLNQRLSEVIEVGRFDTSVNFGFRAEVSCA